MPARSRSTLIPPLVTLAIAISASVVVGFVVRGSLSVAAAETSAVAAVNAAHSTVGDAIAHAINVGFGPVWAGVIALVAAIVVGVASRSAWATVRTVVLIGVPWALADVIRINMTLGVGLELTSVIFTVVLAGALTWQLALRRYVPFVYWVTVVVVSVAGTLYTDILTDDLGVPLALSTTVFAVILAVVFAVWYRSQRTLSIHSITTRRRELFYWLAILVTFALGTASGDWILELTGWSPGISVLLPAGLIVAVAIGWRLDANAVLSFWLAYILTRPLGANLGDWMGFPTTDGGLGLGVALTSVIFLVAILATVIYLSVTRADTIETQRRTRPVVTSRRRERGMVVYFVAVGLAAAGLLFWASAQPHSTAAASEESGPAATVTLAPGQSAVANFPSADVAGFVTITDDTLALVQKGDQTAATARVTDLEKAWDKAQPKLEALDSAGWTFLDGRIDAVLTAVRAASPDVATEKDALHALLDGLRS